MTPLKMTVLNKIADGRQITFLSKAKVRIDGQTYHYRENKFRNSGYQPFGLNPNSLSADFEVWICGSESIYYLIPKSVVSQIYHSGATPNQTPGQENIVTINIDTRANRLKIREAIALDGMDFSPYRNKTTSDFSKTVIIPPTEEVVTVAKYGRGGEGKEHKQLKEWLAANPNFFGLPTNSTAEIDNHTFLSADRPDIIFTTPDNNYFIVEVEIENCFPGAYQALKYRTLLCAEKRLSLNSDRVKTSLAARVIKKDVKEFCDKYEVLTYILKK